MRKNKEDTEISKLRILLAAEEEFCQRGFIAANMYTIAKAAGMTKGAIFWHYESKAGLFKAVIHRATERLKVLFRETFSLPLPIMEKCKQIIIQIKKDRAFEILLVLSSMDSIGEIPKDLLKECTRELSTIFENFFTHLDDAKAKGEIPVSIDNRDILVPITLIISGFAKSRELKNLIPLNGKYIDNELIIDTFFNGILSVQEKVS